MIDTFFLRQAEAMLRPTGLNELVGGYRESASEPLDALQLDERRCRFLDWSRTIVTAVLLDLDERTDIMVAEQGLTYLLARDLEHAKAAAVWVAFHGMSAITEALQHLPGYALVLLAARPSDTADRFMARDAFWAAVLNRS